MNRNHLYLSAILVAMLFCGVRGECPSADLTGDCFVDFEDFAILASQWLTTDPCIPDGFVYIPDGQFLMGDSFTEVGSDERPVHTVSLDSFAIGKFEVTNQQYCEYLNSALDSNSIYVSGGMVYGIGNNQPYCHTSTFSSYSQIDYNDVVFSVRTKGGRSMSNDPMVYVSWYGAAAYCNWLSQQEGREQCYNLSTWTCDFNKHGYRLPTEAEWEYAARGGLSGKRFPLGDTISHTQANYYGDSSYSYDKSTTQGYHPLWNDGIEPYTSPVGFFDGAMKYKTDYNWPGSSTSYQTTSGANNYGLYDMAGNVCEWCNDWYSSTYYSSSPLNNPTGPTSGTYPFLVLRGGSWRYRAISSRVAERINGPAFQVGTIGFRVVLDLN
jgi:formylglycine-generating enzyme required for sulfatase activity